MQLEEILPLAEIKAFYGDELQTYTGTLAHLADALERETYTIGAGISNSWMRICQKHGFAIKSLSNFLDRVYLPDVQMTCPIPRQSAIVEIERLTGKPFITGMAYSKCLFRNELAAELCVLETYPNVLNLAQVKFRDLNRPIPPSQRRFEKQTHEGLDLLPTLVERMQTYATQHGLQWITLSAETEELMAVFARHGFMIATYDKAMESRHMEMSVQ